MEVCKWISCLMGWILTCISMGQGRLYGWSRYLPAYIALDTETCMAFTQGHAVAMTLTANHWPCRCLSPQTWPSACTPHPGPACSYRPEPVRLALSPFPSWPAAGETACAPPDMSHPSCNRLSHTRSAKTCRACSNSLKVALSHSSWGLKASQCMLLTHGRARTSSILKKRSHSPVFGCLIAAGLYGPCVSLSHCRGRSILLQSRAD